MSRQRLYIVLAVLLLAIVAVAVAFAFTSRSRISTTTSEYVVKAGDTCRKIAFEHNVSVESIVELNQLAPDCRDLSVDQKLIIPAHTP